MARGGAAKRNEDTTQGMWGQRFGAAAELPLGAERYVLPVAPAISSPVTLPTASSTERILQHLRKRPGQPA